MKKVSIDYFEDKFARCEDLDTETMCNIERKNVPKKAKEGDILVICDDEKIFIDKKETRSRRKKMTELQNEVFYKNKLKNGRE